MIGLTVRFRYENIIGYAGTREGPLRGRVMALSGRTLIVATRSGKIYYVDGDECRIEMDRAKIVPPNSFPDGYNLFGDD